MLRRVMQEFGDKVLTKDDLKAAVTEYLSEHPNAMDTFKGIADWWIPRQQVRVDLDMLATVLKDLTGQGILEEVQYAGEAKLYHLKAKQ
jgi:hypothetical protein